MTILEYFISLQPIETKTGLLKFRKARKSDKNFRSLPAVVDLPTPKNTDEIKVMREIEILSDDDAEDLFEDIKLSLRNAKGEAVNESLKETGLNLKNITILQPVNVRDTYKLAKSYILNKVTNKIIPDEMCTPEGLIKILETKVPDKEVRDSLLAPLYKPVSFIYDPTLPFGYQDYSEKLQEIQREVMDCPEFNLSSEQPWRFLEPSKTYPKAFVKFMDLLFPIKEERLEVYNWIQTAAYHKNFYALLLTGGRGIGKGIFSDLCKRIIAGQDSEAYEAPESMMGSSHFNSELIGARLCIADEAVLRGSNKERLKRLLNDYATLEGKGTNAQKNIRLWANFIISNNFPFNNEIEWDERRFFIPQLLTDKLEANWDKDTIGRFVEKFKSSDQYIRDIMNYIEGQIGPDLNIKTYPLYTPTFYKLVKSSLKPWQVTCLEYVFDNPDSSRRDTYSLTELRKYHTTKHRGSSDERDSSKNFPQNTTVHTFFESYRHGPDKIKVASMDLLGRDSKVTYTYEYLKEKSK